MSDPSLSTLCQICHLHPKKYTCPRCTARTCSLPCTLRHKARTPCTGIRDPTVYMPRAKLYTAAGIDHDYNFLAKVERDVCRVNKEIVEARGLVATGELMSGGDVRRGYRPVGWRKGIEQERERENVNGFRAKGRRSYIETGTQVEREMRDLDIKCLGAPKGMQRNMENTTKWSKAQKCVNWSVEWVVGEERGLGTCFGKWSVARTWGMRILEAKRQGLSKGERKRLREELVEERKAKRARVDAVDYMSPLIAPKIWQQASSSAWKVESQPRFQSANLAFSEQPTQFTESECLDAAKHLDFYLLRPNTPLNVAKVLIPIDETAPLNTVLMGKTILEFPTIYVFEKGRVSAGFIMEEEFLTAKDEVTDDDDSSEEESSSEESESDEEDESSQEDTSSEDEVEDVDMDDGGLKVFM